MPVIIQIVHDKGWIQLTQLVIHDKTGNVKRKVIRVSNEEFSEISAAFQHKTALTLVREHHAGGEHE